jgi:uncharacterized protein (DUF2267 family)
MTSTSVTSIDRTIEKTNVWLNELMEELGWEDLERAYHALRAVLHAIRDRLCVTDAANLGAQLPMLVRGLYYDGWTPVGKPLPERNCEQFLAAVSDAFRDDPGLDAQLVTRTVLRLLAKHATLGEIAGVKNSLPAEFRDLQ